MTKIWSKQPKHFYSDILTDRPANEQAKDRYDWLLLLLLRLAVAVISILAAFGIAGA